MAVEADTSLIFHFLVQGMAVEVEEMLYLVDNMTGHLGFWYNQQEDMIYLSHLVYMAVEADMMDRLD
jgi:hypothetical protein